MLSFEAENSITFCSRSSASRVLGGSVCAPCYPRFVDMKLLDYPRHAPFVDLFLCLGFAILFALFPNSLSKFAPISSLSKTLPDIVRAFPCRSFFADFIAFLFFISSIGGGLPYFLSSVRKSFGRSRRTISWLPFLGMVLLGSSHENLSKKKSQASAALKH